MISSLKRGAYVVRRSVGPSVLFGSGYTAHWVQTQDETAPQVFAAATVNATTSFKRAVVAMGSYLPGEPKDWPHDALAELQASELSGLDEWVTQLQEQELESPMLRRTILRLLCQQVESELSTEAGIADEDLAKLVEQLSTNASALEASSSDLAQVQMLLPMSATLLALVSDGKGWQDRMGCDSALHIANAAMIACTWLTARSIACPNGGSAANSLSEEERESVVENLSSFWQALGQSRAAPLIRSVPKASRTPQMMELQRDLEQRISSFAGAPLRGQTTIVVREPLPQNVRSSIASVMKASSWSKSKPIAIPATSRKPETARAPVAVVDTQRATSTATPQASDIEAAVDTSESQVAASKVSSASRVLHYAAWAAVMGIGVLAVSEDGLGFLKFHAAPEAWRPALKSVLQRSAMRVEELVLKDDPPTPGAPNMADTITLGPQS